MSQSYFRQSAAIVSLLLFGLVSTTQASLITVSTYDIDQAILANSVVTVPGYNFTYTGSDSHFENEDRYFNLNGTPYKYTQTRYSGGGGTLNDGFFGTFDSSNNNYDDTQIFAVNNTPGGDAGGFPGDFIANPKFTFNFTGANRVGEIVLYANGEDVNSSAFGNLQWLMVEIEGQSEAILAKDVGFRRLELDLRGTTLAGISTSQVILRDLVLEDSTNEL